MKKLLLVIAVVAVASSSCRLGWGKRVAGNGNIKSDEHTVSDFKSVKVSGGMNVYLSQGNIKPVKIESDDNLLAYVEVIQQGDELIIREKEGFNLDPSNETKIYITAPVYNKIELSGAGNIFTEGKITNSEDMEIHVSGAGDVKMELKAPSIRTNMSGAGSISLKGDTRDLDINLSGAGSAHCYDLLSENTKVRISGVGSAEVYASVSLDASVSGVGDVKYKGGASNVNQNVSGAGSVKKID